MYLENTLLSFTVFISQEKTLTVENQTYNIMASGDANLDFYNDALPWEPTRDCYPTNDDLMQYYISHIKANRDRNAVKRDLDLFVK